MNQNLRFLTFSTCRRRRTWGVVCWCDTRDIFWTSVSLNAVTATDTAIAFFFMIKICVAPTPAAATTTSSSPLITNITYMYRFTRFNKRRLPMGLCLCALIFCCGARLQSIRIRVPCLGHADGEHAERVQLVFAPTKLCMLYSR